MLKLVLVWVTNAYMCACWIFIHQMLYKCHEYNYKYWLYFVENSKHDKDLSLARKVIDAKSPERVITIRTYPGKSGRYMLCSMFNVKMCTKAKIFA